VDRRRDGVEECVGRRVRDLGEQFLELVDDEQQLRALGKHPPDRPADA
jgi:hypothetical protein